MQENVSVITLDTLRTEKKAAIVRIGEQHGASNIRVSARSPVVIIARRATSIFAWISRRDVRSST